MSIVCSHENNLLIFNKLIPCPVLMSLLRVVHVSCTILGVLIYLSFALLSNALSQEMDWTKENYVPDPRSEVAGARS